MRYKLSNWFVEVPYTPIDWAYVKLVDGREYPALVIGFKTRYVREPLALPVVERLAAQPGQDWEFP